MHGEAKDRTTYQDAVEYLCRHARTLRAMIPQTTWEASFSIVRESDPTTARWRDAVRALHDAAEDAGIPGGLGLQPLLGGFPAGPTPRTIGWVCPAGRCARVELREDPTTEAPQCALSGQPMRLVD